MNIKAIIISIGAFITILTGLYFNNYKIPEEVNNEIIDNVLVNLESEIKEELTEIQVNNVVLETEAIDEQIDTNIAEEKIIEEPKKEEIKTANVQKQEKQQTEKVTTKPTQQTTKVESTQVQETKVQEVINENPKPEATPKEPDKPICTSTKHGVGVGNSNKWFNSYDEAVSYYTNLITDYSNKVKSGEITTEEYYSKCPYGYETWSCQYCGKWTLNYYMR